MKKVFYYSLLALLSLSVLFSPIPAQANTPNSMMVYSKLATDTVPYYRIWDGSAWGSELSATAVGANIEYIVLKFSRTRNEAVLGTLDGTGDIRTQIWNGSSWSATTLHANIGTTNDAYRGFDIEYESSGDRAVIVYNNANAVTPAYQIWNGSSWSAAANIGTVPTTGTPRWIELAANPLSSSNEASLIYIDSNRDIYGMVWNGSSWSNMGDSVVWDATGAIDTKKSVDVEYEQTSGRAMFIWADSVRNDQYYRIWNGSTLTANTFLEILATGGAGEWVELVADASSGSNNIMYGVQDSAADLNTRLWNGSTWDTATEHPEHSGAVENIQSKNFDLVFETTPANAGKAWLVYGNGSTVTRKLWSGTAWGTVTTSGDDTSFINLHANPTSGAIFMGVYQTAQSATDDILEAHLTGGGSVWSADAQIWAGPIVAEPVMSRIDIASDKYSPNPMPTTTSISPTFKYVGDAQFSMTVNGTNFVSNSVVKFDGSSRSTTYVSSTQLTATILASDLLTASSSILITVTNPTPGGGTSNAQTFQVRNPMPTTTSIDPTFKYVGDTAFTMTVTGTGFNTSSVVKFDGSARSTTFVSSSTIQAAILTGDLTVASSSILITVTNPTPGGGTSNAQTFQVRNPMPTTTSIDPTFKYVGDTAFTMTVTGTGFNTSSVVKFDGSARSTTFVSSSTIQAAILTGDLTVASSSILITVTNPTPGGGTSNAQTFQVRNPMPTTTSIDPTFKYVGDAQFDMTVNGTNFVSNSVVKFDGSSRSTTYVSATQLTATILASDLLTASSSILITVTNPTPGGGTSNAQTFQVRNPMPTTTSIDPTFKYVGDAQFDMTVNGTNFVSNSVVKFDGSSRSTTYVSATQLTATILASDLLTASSSILITVTNPTPGGGTSNAQVFQVITPDNPVPVTTSISPDTKYVGDSQFEMTVNGSNFIAASVVKFNGSSRATTYINSTQLTATILDTDLLTASSSILITVTNPTPGGGTSNAQTFQVLNPMPTTTSISPTYKTVGDAQFSMAVNGTNFVSNSVVKFDGSSRSTTYVSATQLTATILASDLLTASSSILITVTNPTPGGGTSNAQTFTVYNPTPTTTSISPSTKIIDSAQFDMTVNGTNFVNGATVKFAGSARSTTYISATELTATIPASDLTVLGTFDITVANPAPVMAESNAQQFYVINQSPFISTISPSYKTVGDPQFEMTVNGSNFIATSVVNFNGSARSTVYVNGTQLTATILAGDLLVATSSALITVTNPAPGGGTSDAKVFIVYNPTPTITSISPDTKTVGDAQFDMTVNGTNFLSGATVKLSGSPRATTYVSATQLTATILASDMLNATSSAQITVSNPSPTLADSNTQTFTVNPVGNPLPTTTSISPTSKVAGDPQFTLTVDGTNFIASSVVRFGGVDMVTTYVNATRLTAEIPASEIAVAGNYNVRVFNPLPGGGLSDPQLFTVTAVPPTVAVKFSLSSADSETVGSPVIVTIRALKSDNSIDTNFNNGVTLVSTGSATGGGLASLTNGIATVAIYDSVAETITLSLSDTQGTGLDVSATKNITFVPITVSAPGAGPAVRPTTLEISGRAFPGATISLVEKKSGQPTVSSQTIDISDKGDFKITTIGIIQGEYTYNLLVRDRQGRLSQTKTFNVNFISDSLFERNVLIPPTISLNQTTVRKGDILRISGYAYPQTRVTLNVDGISYETNSTVAGTYEFSINTALISDGSHFARVKGTDTQTRLETDWSPAQSFLISPVTTVSANIDLDRNGIIDLRDWSIFLSRFNSSNPDIIRTVDFNRDGKVDVADRTIFLANYATQTTR